MHVSSGNGTVRFSQPGALQSVCLARGNINHHIVPVSKSGSSFTATGRLLQDVYNGRKYWGFKSETYKTRDSNKISGIYEPTGKEVRSKRSWGGHVFTDVEISELLKGNPIMFTYDGRNGPATAIGKLGEGEYNGRKYWGFQKN